MYSTKEKLRILREINNPEAVGADLALFRQALPADPRLVKFDLSPQRHAEEITLSLLDHYTREEIVANRRDHSKQIEQPDNSDLKDMTDDERAVFDGYNRAQRDRIREIMAVDSLEEALNNCSILESEGFGVAAERLRPQIQKAIAERNSQKLAGEGSGDGAGEGAGEAAGEGSGDGAGEGAGEAAGEAAGEGSGDGTGEAAGEGSGEETQEGDGTGDKTDKEEKPADEPEKEKPSAAAAAGEEAKKKSGKSKSTQE